MEAKQVHAQKKYAQAVNSTTHIPPSNPSTPLERRVETGAYKVLYYNNDAENLLDIASFSNIHRHTQPIVLVKRLEDTIINAEREPPLHRASKPIENGARSHAKCETEKPPEFSSSVSPPSKTKSGIKLMKKPSPVLKKTVIFKKKIDTTKAKIVTTKTRVNKMNELDVVSPLTDDEQPLTAIIADATQKFPTGERSSRPQIHRRHRRDQSFIQNGPAITSTHQHKEPLQSRRRASSPYQLRWQDSSRRDDHVHPRSPPPEEEGTPIPGFHGDPEHQRHHIVTRKSNSDVALVTGSFRKLEID